MAFDSFNKIELNRMYSNSSYGYRATRLEPLTLEEIMIDLRLTIAYIESRENNGN